MKICGVYKVTNPLGEVYIGQSSSVKERWQAHRTGKLNYERLFKASIAEHGYYAHTFELLEACHKHELRIKEREYQETYFLSGVPMLNLVSAKIGGYPTRTHPTTKKLLADRTIRVHTGLKRSEESKGNMRKAASYKSKPVIKMDLNNVAIMEYPSAHEAARQNNMCRPRISACCNGKSLTHKGFKWKYKD